MLPHDVLPQSTVYDGFAQWRGDGTGAKMVKAWRERPLPFFYSLNMRQHLSRFKVW